MAFLLQRSQNFSQTTVHNYHALKSDSLKVSQITINPFRRALQIISYVQNIM